MDCIKLVPTLDHCIEITARKEFQDSLSQYLGSGHRDRELETRIALLRAFLESADFRRLRSQSERYLVEGEDVTFLICWKNGEVRYEMLLDEADQARIEHTKSRLCSPTDQ